MKILSFWPTEIFVFENYLPGKQHGKIKKLITKDAEYFTYAALDAKILDTAQLLLEHYDYKGSLKPEITEMWTNIRKTNQPHPPHVHANNDYSGIYYIDECTSTFFLDPRQQNLTTDLGFNQPVRKIRGEPNKCVIFPSWLMHWVPNNDQPTDRKTISFNIKYRGKIGKPGSFTEVQA